MGITDISIPEIDTGGERQMRLPGVLRGVLTLMGGFYPGFFTSVSQLFSALFLIILAGMWRVTPVYP